MSRAEFNGASKAEKIAARAGQLSGMLFGRTINAFEDACQAFKSLANGDVPAFQTLGISAIKALVQKAQTIPTAPMQVQPSEFRMQAEAKGLAKGVRGVASAFKRAHTQSFEQERKPRMAAKAPTLKPA